MIAAPTPAHTEVLDRLASAVRDDPRWRWLELSCSLAEGRGDELSDIDAGVGYAEGVDVDGAGHELVAAAGEPIDVLVQRFSGREDARRFAVEYRSGIQLDLVLLPAASRPGLPPGSVALVDEDATLDHPWQPPVADPPPDDQRREWTMLAWWALSDVAKYVRRGSLLEAVERVDAARADALRLFAAAHGVRFATFGLTSLLDADPPLLPPAVEAMFATPRDAGAVVAAATAVADLLDEVGVATPWAALARRRIAQ